jgi:NADH:ubiquinone oxidoreductase subunit 6 (subunit J)
MGMQIAFWILGAVILLAALAVVIMKNVFRAALALILCFVAVAGVYITLSADFLAVVQILVYVGGISILILLAIMLTHNLPDGSQANKLRFPAFLIAAAFLVLVIYSVINTTFPVIESTPDVPTTAFLGLYLFEQERFLLPMEIAGMLLLSAIIGAIVMAREK